MEISPSGHRGQIVRSRVVEEQESVTERVIILNHNMVDQTVLVRIMQTSLVMFMSAPVSIFPLNPIYNNQSEHYPNH